MVGRLYIIIHEKNLVKGLVLNMVNPAFHLSDLSLVLGAQPKMARSGIEPQLNGKMSSMSSNNNCGKLGISPMWIEETGF